MCISLPPFSKTSARIRVPFVRSGTIPRANDREIITPAGSRQYPHEKNTRLQGATGWEVHISRRMLYGQYRDRECAADCLGHSADARGQFRELVKGQRLGAVRERLVRLRVHLDHQAVRAGGNAGQ